MQIKCSKSLQCRRYVPDELTIVVMGAGGDEVVELLGARAAVDQHLGAPANNEAGHVVLYRRPKSA